MTRIFVFICNIHISIDSMIHSNNNIKELLHKEHMQLSETTLAAVLFFFFIYLLFYYSASIALFKASITSSGFNGFEIKPFAPIF